MKIFIAGAGTMGAGIAQVFAQGGLTAIIYDISDEIVSKSAAGFAKNITKLVEKGKIDENQKDEILARVSFTADLNKAADCTLAIEAVYENADVKKELFSKLASFHGDRISTYVKKLCYEALEDFEDLQAIKEYEKSESYGKPGIPHNEFWESLNIDV